MDPILLDIPSEFSTERLQARPYRAGDGACYYQALRTNWEHLYEFLPEMNLLYNIPAPDSNEGLGFESQYHTRPPNRKETINEDRQCGQ